MEMKLRNRIVAWFLTICLSVTLIPNMGHAEEVDKAKEAPKKQEAVKAENVTEEDVIEKTETTTTYDLGGGEKMAVFHGGSVRYRDDSGKLVDYDSSLVAIDSGEKTIQNESLEDYAYQNRQGDKKQYMP